MDREDQPTTLFVYGTLRPGHAPEEVSAAVGRLKRVGNGSVRGRLLQLDGYPGLVLDESEQRVVGEIFEVPDHKTLRELDAYEEFIPENPSASLFVRRAAPVRLNHGETMHCWVYVYNRAG